MQFHYRLFGLHIESEIELPELLPARPADKADVEIFFSQDHEQPGLSEEPRSEEGGCSFSVAAIGKYGIMAGREIHVTARPDAPLRNVRLFLLGSAMGLLLQQRGLLPLHANVIEIGGQGIAFMGPSGSGKSTLAAVFLDEGFNVVADDVCAIESGESGSAVVHGGVSRLRLWEDALVSSGRTPADYQLSFDGDEQFRKFDVPIDVGEGRPLPLGAIIELAAGEHIRIDRLSGVKALEALFANTYRGQYMSMAGGAEAHWEACVRLVSGIPVFRLERPFNPESNSKVVDSFKRDPKLLNQGPEMINDSGGR